ncbi:MAG: hypothetical protein K8R02_06060 [Anaerohalosphaeraceae bacterium]|nr:hypothetical protein [Anaerohalosphaeraceae bacterium]
MDKAKLEKIENARALLSEIQDFDIAKLPRTEDLGKELNFKAAVDPAEKIILLYKKLPIDVLDSLSGNMVDQIASIAKTNLDTLKRIMKVSAQQAVSERASLIQKLVSSYDNTFNNLHPAISYSVHKSTDFARLEAEAQEAVKNIEEKSKAISGTMDTNAAEAKKILADIKKVAEEQGVSQQAIYFKNEADGHSKASYAWLVITAMLAVGLIIVSILFLEWNIGHKDNNDYYAIVQLTVSKILIFGTLSSMLAMAAKNYFANRHNVIINRHRENALKTYTALVDAAGEDANGDIVLTKAADSIFMSQTTGFDKSDSRDGKALSMLNIAPAAIRGMSENS